MKGSKWFIGLTLVILLVSPISNGADLDEWDELDTLDDTSVSYQPTPIPEQAPKESLPQPSVIRTKVLPISMGFFLLLSLLIGLIGARTNAKIGLAFEETFCKQPDGILWKQFTRLGKGAGSKTLLVNESPCRSKLHCRGHQHLEGAVITVNLKRRHELLSGLFEWLTGVEDSICVEFYLKEGVMPPMVLAIASKMNYKELLRTNTDVKSLAEELTVDESILKDWSSDDLVVFAEHSSYFYDMMTRPMMTQIFGVTAFRRVGKLFRGLQISSESNSNHRKVMRWWLTVPKAENMDELKVMFQAIFAMLGQINDYKISAERRQKAEKARLELLTRPSSKQNTVRKR